MAGPPNDTSEIRAWLTTQLKLEDVPEPIWELLVEDEYVEEAQYPPDFPDARDELVRQARKLLKIYRGGSDSPQVPKKQRTTKRQKATSASRSEVVGKIAAKIAKAKASKGTDASPNGDDERAVTESPVVWTIENNLITVTAKPWVSLEEVCMAFKNARDIWFRTETPSERRVELVDFVTSFCEGYYNEERGVSGLLRGPDWPGWRQIMEQWNQRYPQGHDWHYTDVRRFSRDFREAFETLTLFENF